jgi:hypothetical protein
MKRLARFLLLAWLAGCGPIGDPSGPGRIEPRTEVVLEPADLERAVRIDSVVWALDLASLDPGRSRELEGTFRAVFANLTDQELALRYDLRFYDPDDFLVDDYIPLGQPVMLAPRQTRRVEGDLLIQAGDPDELERIATLRLYARTAGAPP